jgi:hypothetical protein
VYCDAAIVSQGVCRGYVITAFDNEAVAQRVLDCVAPFPEESIVFPSSLQVSRESKGHLA